MGMNNKIEEGNELVIGEQGGQDNGIGQQIGGQDNGIGFIEQQIGKISVDKTSSQFRSKFDTMMEEM